jgi:GAF domain-containing protein
MLALEERGWGGRAARTVAEQQAAVVEQLCATSRRVLFTDLAAPAGETGRQLPAHAYRDWGGVVADRLAPRLAASAAAVSAESPSVFRARNDEWSRQKALTAMRLSADQPNPLLEELVREARRYHRVAGAALTLLDGDLQWSLAAEPALPPRPRADGYCQVTVRHDGITLINDAQKDPRVAGMPVAQRLRFYAGYPLHSWDGHRIGSLCIFDPKPRALLECDFGRLHDLARRAEQELWARALRSG